MASTQALLAELDTVKRRAANMRSRAADKAEEAVDAAAVVLGGAAGGYVDAKWGQKKVMGIGINLAVGAALAATGLMEWAGKQSSLAGSVGNGLLAWEAGKAVHARTAQSGQTAGVGATVHQFPGRQAIGVEDLYQRFAHMRAG